MNLWYDWIASRDIRVLVVFAPNLGDQLELNPHSIIDVSRILYIQNLNDKYYGNIHLLM